MTSLLASLPSRAGLAAAGSACALLLAPSAMAAGVPHKKYQCYQFTPGIGFMYAGGFKLVSASKYKAISGGGGAYALRGKSVTFKNGTDKTFSGKVGHDKTGKLVITLTLKSDQGISENCS